MKKTSKPRKVVVENFAYLIENTLERSELILAAQAITDKLQNMAENLAKIEANDIMPILDSLKTAFGAASADRFNEVASTQVHAVLDTLKTAKDGIGTEIARFESIVNGGSGNDMSLDTTDLPEPEMDTDTETVDPMKLGDDSKDFEADLDGPEEAATVPFDDDSTDMKATFAGRAKKESARPRGRKIFESERSSSMTDNLDRLSMFHGRAANLAMSIEAEIDAMTLPGNERSDLSDLLCHVSCVGCESSYWDGGDVDSKIEAKVRSAHIDTRVPEIKKVVNQIKKLAHMCAIKHEENLEEMAPVVDLDDEFLDLDDTDLSVDMMGVDPYRFSNRDPERPVMVETRAIKALRESNDPDAMVLATFKRLLSESKLGAAGSASFCAKTFGIDFNDVVEIIREAKSAKKKIPPAFFAHMKKKKKVKEEAKLAAVVAPKLKNTEMKNTGPGIENREPKTHEVPAKPFSSFKRMKATSPSAETTDGEKNMTASEPKKSGSVTLMSVPTKRTTTNETKK